MNDDYQKTPDELLKAVNEQESSAHKAKLKIFLGMAAGCGKTYAMLENAQLLKAQGVDVVVGVVNTHGRTETAALLEGLKVIPEKPFEYKGIVVTEFDIDEVLKIHPQVVLVDELAHTNVPGSRHPKRWQDVKEILDNGIDVHTTLNVQHIESLKDIVEGITGVTIRETVNDTIIEGAASIELIDLAPNELLERLKEGKVYLGDKSEVAAQNFFQEDRLTALREIVLRYAAEKVDHELRGLVSTVGGTIDWKPRERLMIALSQSPYAQKLIRTTRRLASNLHAPWIALYIDTGNTLSVEENNQLTKNIDLARNFGAEIIMTTDDDIVDGIKRIARQRAVSQIIVGRPPVKTFFGLFELETIVDRLSKECSDIDIHIIRQEKALTKYRKKITAFRKEKSGYAYQAAFATAATLGLVGWAAVHIIGYKAVGFLYLIAILGLSLFFTKGPVLFATMLLGFIWEFFFVPLGPRGVPSYEDIALLLVYVLTSVATGILVDRERHKKDLLERREKTAQAMYDIIRKIANTHRGDTAFNAVKEKLGELFSGTFDILIKQSDSGLMLDKNIPLLSDEKEKNAALWVFEHNNEAGWSTDTLPQSKNLYIPLIGLQDTVGILVFRPNSDKTLSLEDKNFLHNISQQLARFFERRLSDDNIKKEEQRKRIENMHTTILKKISRVFQQPLSVLGNSMTKIKDDLKRGSENPELLSEIDKMEDAKEHLKDILANISAMALLSEGIIPLNISLHSMNDIIEECCQNLNGITQEHILNINIEENLPLVPMDKSLVMNLLLNLMTNAVCYSPSKSIVEVEARKVDRFVLLSVADEGQGIPGDQLEAIFEVFYTLTDDSPRSIGLGLAIAKAIAELHHGYLKAANRPVRGAIFTLYLPFE